MVGIVLHQHQLGVQQRIVSDGTDVLLYPRPVGQLPVEVHRGQKVAAGKGVRADYDERSGKVDLGQTGTSGESAAPDVLDPGAQGRVLQPCAALEGIGADAGHAAGGDKAVQPGAVFKAVGRDALDLAGEDRLGQTGAAGECAHVHRFQIAGGVEERVDRSDACAVLERVGADLFHRAGQDADHVAVAARLVAQADAALKGVVADLLHVAGEQEIPGFGQTVEGVVADAADLGAHTDRIDLIPVLIPGSVAGILIIRHGVVQNAVFDLQRAVLVQVPQRTARQAKVDRLQPVSRGRQGVRVRGLAGDGRFGILFCDRGDDASVLCRLDAAFSALRLLRQGGGREQAEEHEQRHQQAQKSFAASHGASSFIVSRFYTSGSQVYRPIHNKNNMKA